MQGFCTPLLIYLPRRQLVAQSRQCDHTLPLNIFEISMRRQKKSKTAYIQLGEAM